MSGVIRRRELMVTDEGEAVTDYPERIKIVFETTSANKTVTLGYYFNFYISSILLDGSTISGTGSNPDITVPTAGEHTVYIALKTTPSYTSGGYSIVVPPGSYVRLPENFGTKYGQNGSYPLSWTVNYNNYPGILECLNAVPFTSSSTFSSKYISNLNQMCSEIRIPKGSKQAYINADYSSNKLIEVKYKL